MKPHNLFSYNTVNNEIEILDFDHSLTSILIPAKIRSTIAF